VTDTRTPALFRRGFAFRLPLPETGQDRFQHRSRSPRLTPNLFRPCSGHRFPPGDHRRRSGLVSRGLSCRSPSRSITCSAAGSGGDGFFACVSSKAKGRS